MYRDHVACLNEAMRDDPDIFLRGVTFAVLSIRTQFVRVSDQMKEVEHAGTNARALWGYKRGSYDYLRKHKFALWEMIKDAQTSEEGIEALCRVPGIGIVKAAFVLQMMGHDIGCLDTRNIERLKLNPREWRTDGEERKNTLAFKRKIERYVDFTSGQAETLWNDWCGDVSRVYKVSAEEISRDHLIIIPRAAFKRYRQPTMPVPYVSRQTIPFAA